MKYKPDWESAREMYDSFWNDEELERCLLWAVSYRSTSLFRDNSLLENFLMPNYQIRVGGEELTKRWTDFDFLLSYHESVFSSLYYGAEALPVFWVNLGPGSLAAYLGSGLVFREDTIWFKPSLGSLCDFVPRLNPENEWWKLTKWLTKQASEYGKEKFLVGIADLGGAGDILAHLRGAENLCIDLVESKEKVKEVEFGLMEIWIRCYEELYTLIDSSSCFVSHWLGTWAPGKHYPTQCDFSAMVSPALFQEIFVPVLQKQSRYLDFPIYHLDGPSALRHLQVLLEMREVKAIQWVPGAGAPRILDWIPLLQGIQIRGKKVIAYADPKEALEIVQYLEPSKTMLIIDQIFPTEEDLRDFIHIITKRCGRRFKVKHGKGGD